MRQRARLSGRRTQVHTGYLLRQVLLVHHLQFCVAQPVVVQLPSVWKQKKDNNELNLLFYLKTSSKFKFPYHVSCGL